MKLNLYVVILLLLCVNSFAQVAIGTLNPPTTAAVLHLEALQPNTINFGGFLMPRVTESQQLQIPVSTVDDSDDGLMVFVSDFITGKHCWEIYDGVDHVWRSINCPSVAGCSTIYYEEDFESYASDTGVTGLSSSNGDYPGAVTKWTLTSFTGFGSTTPDLPGTLIDADDYALIKAGELEFRDTNGTFIFETQSIDITGATDLIIAMDVKGTGDFEYVTGTHAGDFSCGVNNSDYLDLEYSIDGGAFTEVSNFSGLGTADHTIVFDETFASDGSLVNISTVLTGLTNSSIVVRARLQNWAGGEYITIDNIVVRCN